MSTTRTGSPTEEPATTVAMADKRKKKMAGLQDETEGMVPVRLQGHRKLRYRDSLLGVDKGDL